MNLTPQTDPAPPARKRRRARLSTLPAEAAAPPPPSATPPAESDLSGQADAPAAPDRSALFARLERCAAECEQVESLLGGRGVPELETIIKLHRVLILRFSLEAEISPEMLKLIDGLMKPVMDWARIEEKRKDRELAEQKYRDQVEAEKAQASRESAASGSAASGALQPATLEKIQEELSLL